MASKQVAAKGQQSLFSFFKKNTSAPADPIAVAPSTANPNKPSSPHAVATKSNSDSLPVTESALSKNRSIVGKHVEVRRRKIGHVSGCSY